MTTYDALVLAETVRLLTGYTRAGASVFTPLDWATYDGEYPVVLARISLVDRESLGRGQSQFTTTATVAISARLQMGALPDDVGAQELLSQLEAFEGEILRAVVNHPDLMTGLQQMPFIRSQRRVSAEGKFHLGEAVIEIGMEYYEGPEAFYPIPSTQLTDARINDPGVFDGLTPTELEADAPIPQD
jgi:hypothetical protein